MLCPHLPNDSSPIILFLFQGLRGLPGTRQASSEPHATCKAVAPSAALLSPEASCLLSGQPFHAYLSPGGFLRGLQSPACPFSLSPSFCPPPLTQANTHSSPSKSNNQKSNKPKNLYFLFSSHNTCDSKCMFSQTNLPTQVSRHQLLIINSTLTLTPQGQHRPHRLRTQSPETAPISEVRCKAQVGDCT